MRPLCSLEYDAVIKVARIQTKRIGQERGVDEAVTQEVQMVHLILFVESSSGTKSV